MLLARRFTYVHEPKTGGSFVTHVVGLIHGGRTNVRISRLRAPALRLGLPSLAFYPERLRAVRAGAGQGSTRYGRVYDWNDHGTCSEIPLAHRSRPILATVRNPLETYVSLYLFGWWKRPGYLHLYERAFPGFRHRFPTFPDLSFRDYLELQHADCTLPQSRSLEVVEAPGYLTERFVRYYFRLPRKHPSPSLDVGAVLRRIDGGYLQRDRLRRDLFPVRFLRTARLNDELTDVLLELGYESEDVEFVRAFKHVVPAGGARVELADRAASEEWEQYYTPELLSTIRSRERLIFELFPDLDSGPP